MANIADLIKEFRDLRDDLDARRKDYTLFEKETKERMLDLETQMLDIAAQTGVDSFKTVHGTAFRTTKTYARLSTGPEAKELRIQYAINNDDFGLFTSHVNKTHAKELLDNGVNLAEVGIDWVEEYTIGFRSPTK